MKQHKWILFFLLIGFFACNDDDSIFNASTEGLQLKFTPVAGGAMMYYTLPNNSDIFAMNVRYKNWQGEDILKVCGYSGDSLLLDGFTREQEVSVKVSFVNHRDEESGVSEYKFRTLDSAPWSFFNDLEVHPSWNGFQVIYKSPAVVTGMAHVFYVGTNPVTHQEDTLLVKSFPISRGGDTLNFITKQTRPKNTVVIRTEDFQGYRVRQAVFPEIDAFQTEQWPMTAENLIDIYKLSQESVKAKIGAQYLFDGELKGSARLLASANQNPASNPCTEIYETYLRGPKAFGKPIVLDLREQKIPAWIRIYCLYPMRAIHPALPYEQYDFVKVWAGSYDDKLPCKIKVYGSKTSSNPNTGEWVLLGNLAQDPKTPNASRWVYPTMNLYLSPIDLNELATKDPIFTDITFPALDDTYRYLKVVVEDTFDKENTEIDTNKEEYFTLHELEVYVKKN